MDPFDKSMWAYRAVFKQTNAGGGTIKVNVAAKARMVLLYGLIGPNDYAADRTMVGWIEDSARNKIARLLYGSPIDNVTLSFPIYRETTVVAGDGTSDLSQIAIVSEDDVLVVTALTLALNEELTIIMRALIDMQKPNVTTTGSGGTVTTTTTYDKVI